MEPLQHKRTIRAATASEASDIADTAIPFTVKR